MYESIQHIAEALKAAREKKGITQKALGDQSKIPQSHISKIENGRVDIQLSSLIELSRLLDLELILIPRQVVPVVEALLRGIPSKEGEQVPMYRLEEDEHG